MAAQLMDVGEVRLPKLNAIKIVLQVSLYVLIAVFSKLIVASNFYYRTSMFQYI